MASNGRCVFRCRRVAIASAVAAVSSTDPRSRKSNHGPATGFSAVLPASNMLTIRCVQVVPHLG